MTYKPKYFQDSELYCKCGCGHGGLAAMDEKVLWLADAIRNECGFPLQVNSALRCLVHNKAVGGAPSSYHLRGQAMDLQPIPCTPENVKRLHEVATLLNKKGGIGFYNNFVHVDVGSKRRWVG